MFYLQSVHNVTVKTCYMSKYDTLELPAMVRCFDKGNVMRYITVLTYALVESQ